MKQEGGGVFREGTPYQRRGSLQLWQFLVALLDDPGNAHFIAWTGRGMEFKLIEPEEVHLNLLYLSFNRKPFLSLKTLMGERATLLDKCNQFKKQQLHYSAD